MIRRYRVRWAHFFFGLIAFGVLAGLAIGGGERSGGTARAAEVARTATPGVDGMVGGVVDKRVVLGLGMDAVSGQARFTATPTMTATAQFWFGGQEIPAPLIIFSSGDEEEIRAQRVVGSDTATPTVTPTITPTATWTNCSHSSNAELAECTEFYHTHAHGSGGAVDHGTPNPHHAYPATHNRIPLHGESLGSHHDNWRKYWRYLGGCRGGAGCREWFRDSYWVLSTAPIERSHYHWHKEGIKDTAPNIPAWRNVLRLSGDSALIFAYFIEGGNLPFRLNVADEFRPTGDKVSDFYWEVDTDQDIAVYIGDGYRLEWPDRYARHNWEGNIMERRSLRMSACVQGGGYIIAKCAWRGGSYGDNNISGAGGGGAGMVLQFMVTFPQGGEDAIDKTVAVEIIDSDGDRWRDDVRLILTERAYSDRRADATGTPTPTPPIHIDVDFDPIAPNAGDENIGVTGTVVTVIDENAEGILNQKFLSCSGRPVDEVRARGRLDIEWGSFNTETESNIFSGAPPPTATGTPIPVGATATPTPTHDECLEMLSRDDAGWIAMRFLYEFSKGREVWSSFAWLFFSQPDVTFDISGLRFAGIGIGGPDVGAMLEMDVGRKVFPPDGHDWRPPRGEDGFYAEPNQEYCEEIAERNGERVTADGRKESPLVRYWRSRFSDAVEGFALACAFWKAHPVALRWDVYQKDSNAFLVKNNCHIGHFTRPFDARFRDGMNNRIGGDREYAFELGSDGRFLEDRGGVGWVGKGTDERPIGWIYDHDGGGTRGNLCIIRVPIPGNAKKAQFGHSGDNGTGWQAWNTHRFPAFFQEGFSGTHDIELSALN